MHCRIRRALRRAGMAWALALAGAVSTPGFAAEFDCVIEPRQIVELRTTVEGVIEKVLVDRGDAVTKGQVLVTLESGVEQATADLAKYRSQMEGAVRSGHTRVEFSSMKHERRRNLHEQKFVSAQDRDEAETEKRLAEAELQEAKDNRRVAELDHKRSLEQLKLRTVRSPVNGVVMERLMHPGEVADLSDARKPILKIADIDVLHVEVVLPVEAYGMVKAASQVEVVPEVAGAGKHVANVKTIDRVLDAASGTFGVRLELPNKGHKLPAGVKCKASFPAIPSSLSSSRDSRHRGKPVAAQPSPTTGNAVPGR